ncbi:hypothetical protein SAMN05421858_3700 [Haladaptatus litoreus]|uniref:Uncharacterized protein n=1 Tax=Haladaptatus litoreus TaxID=553468 RepID=A0A1N7DKI1_9EURY|nr:hypothetical protein [Haladaptatus litoreus]SIR76352.1 hypothetical protein SAMN05421858_3700 [Haladaptatus litoreus]
MSQSTPANATLVEQLNALTERVAELESEVKAKDQRIQDVENDFQALTVDLSTTTDRIETLEATLATERDRTATLESRIDDLETENNHLQEELETEREQNYRIRASVSRIINDVREYTSEDGSSVDATSPNIVAEAATVGETLHDTIQRATDNASLLDFSTKRPTNSSIHEKYLTVLGRAEEKARETNSRTVYLNYREVATQYGCAYLTDGYRVMEEMAERVPGVEYVDGHLANPDIDPTTKIEGKRICVEWNHPDLRGWVRAHREEGL